jgi:hypothetical protein
MGENVMMMHDNDKVRVRGDWQRCGERRRSSDGIFDHSSKFGKSS